MDLRGSVQGMRQSFRSFGFGLILSIALVYLVLVAQFASWKDPFIILLAIPPGLAGVLLFLLATGTTLNVMSLMGVVMMVGIVVSNSILIVEFARHLHRDGKPLKEFPLATPSRADDFSRHNPWLDSHGTEAWHGLGSVRALGPRDHRRLARLGCRDRLSRARGVPPRPP